MSNIRVLRIHSIVIIRSEPRSRWYETIGTSVDQLRGSTPPTRPPPTPCRICHSQSFLAHQTHSIERLQLGSAPNHVVARPRPPLRLRNRLRSLRDAQARGALRRWPLSLPVPTACLPCFSSLSARSPELPAWLGVPSLRLREWHGLRCVYVLAVGQSIPGRCCSGEGKEEGKH